MADRWGQKVAGRCPACGGDGSLFVAKGQHVTCSRLECPDPTLVADFLQRPGPRLHVVEFRPDDWHLEHTLRCRLDGLAGCLIHRAINRLSESPRPPGRYEVEMEQGELLYRLIEEADRG